MRTLNVNLNQSMKERSTAHQNLEDIAIEIRVHSKITFKERQIFILRKTNIFE